MKFVLKVLCALVALGLVIWPLLILSWWWTLFFLLAIVYVFLVKYFHKRLAAGLLFVLTLFALYGLHHKGFLAAESRTASCQDRITATVNRTFGRDPKEWKISSSSSQELDESRLNLKRDASRLLYRASQAIDVDVMLTSIARILDLQSAPGLEAPRREVNDGAAGIRQFLNEKNLVKKESRQSQYRDLETAVNSLVEKSQQESDSDGVKKLSSRLVEVANPSNISNLGERMFSLQESLLALTRQAIDVKPIYTIAFDEDSEHTVYREDITVTSRQDAFLSEIDASLLKREADNANTPFKLWINKGNNQKQEVTDPSHIRIEPRAKQVILQYERFGPIEITPYCNCAPLSTIQRVRFVWPASADSIRLRATLASGDVRLPVWFPLDRSQADSQFVREILLPEYSFFAARQPLQFSSHDEHDVLTPTDKLMTSIRNFGADQANWVELLQKKWILRRPSVSKHREYFILENSASALVALFLGGVVGLLFPGFKKAGGE